MLYGFSKRNGLAHETFYLQLQCTHQPFVANVTPLSCLWNVDCHVQQPLTSGRSRHDVGYFGHAHNAPCLSHNPWVSGTTLDKYMDNLSTVYSLRTVYEAITKARIVLTNAARMDFDNRTALD